MEREHTEATKLTSLESLVFYITKVLLYKTVSSPLRITHLLLQSKGTIIEQNTQKPVISFTASTVSTLKSWIFWAVQQKETTDNDTPSMVKYLSQTNASHGSIYSRSNTLNLLSNIINDSNYGLSYLFFGNLYSILRALYLHQSCSECYDDSIMQNHKNSHLGVEYNKGWRSWTVRASRSWRGGSLLWYPLHNIYINHLFNFNGCYEIPTETTFASISKLYSGYLTMVLQSYVHSFMYYKVNDVVRNMLTANRSGFVGKTMIKYIAMGCTNLICYPLDSIKKRQMITHETFHDAFYGITEKQNAGFWSLFDGLYVYLVKCLVSQICIDGCDWLRHWYINRRAIEQSESLERIRDTELICDICLSNKKEYVFNCGHCVCEECKAAMIRAANRCHICRANIVSVQKMFL